MPSLSSLEFLLEEAVGNIVRNRVMSFAAVVTSAISLTIIAGFALAAFTAHKAVNDLPQKFDMAVFLKRECTTEQVIAYKENLQKMPNVKGVNYISKERGWKEFKKSLGTEIRTDDILFNPAPDSFRVVVKDPTRNKELEAALMKLPETDQVSWRPVEVKFLTALSRIVTSAAMATTFLLFLGSVFIIGNTIRLGIYARNREIGIMRLVGAKPAFIRMPFLLEGMLLAGIGAALAVIILKLIGVYLDSISAHLQQVTQFMDSGIVFWQVTIWIVLLGIVLGAVASILSISRYLKEGPLEPRR